MGTSTSCEEDENLLYIKVDGTNQADVIKKEKIKVKVNEEEIALIFADNKLYAIQEKCPHYGGPLHQGDIEELGSRNGPCIVCPWHNWKFNLETGHCVSPSQNHAKNLKIYPIKVNRSGEIRIGFEKIASKYFNTPPD